MGKVEISDENSLNVFNFLKYEGFEKVELGIYNINIICSVSLLVCQGWYLVQFKYLPPDIESILIEVQIL